MKSPAPGRRSGAGAKVSNTEKSHRLYSGLRSSPQAFSRLDDLTVTELRAIWWRQLRLGRRLPAERGIILIDGGLRTDWPRPTTMRPEVEAGPRFGSRP
jgi:hypothetical protein